MLINFDKIVLGPELKDLLRYRNFEVNFDDQITLLTQKTTCVNKKCSKTLDRTESQKYFLSDMFFFVIILV